MTKFWLLIYDICNPKRLSKVAKIVEDYGTRVQKSVFEIEASDIIIRQLRARTKDIMKDDDSIIFFNICQRDREKIQKFGPGKYIESSEDSYTII